MSSSLLDRAFADLSHARDTDPAHSSEENNEPPCSLLDKSHPEVEKEGSCIVHTVELHDTLAGIELRYGVCASRIRQLNGMTSDRLTSHLCLLIPNDSTLPRSSVTGPIVEQNSELTRELNRQVLRTAFPCLSEKEATVYLLEAKVDLRIAMRQCSEDLRWEEEQERTTRAKTSKGLKLFRAFSRNKGKKTACLNVDPSSLL